MVSSRDRSKIHCLRCNCVMQQADTSAGGAQDSSEMKACDLREQEMKNSRGTPQTSGHSAVTTQMEELSEQGSELFTETAEMHTQHYF